MFEHSFPEFALSLTKVPSSLASPVLLILKGLSWGLKGSGMGGQAFPHPAPSILGNDLCAPPRQVIDPQWDCLDSIAGITGRVYQCCSGTSSY
jgi:hypothetical protein